MNIAEPVVRLRTDIQTHNVDQPPVFSTEVKEDEHSSAKEMEIILHLKFVITDWNVPPSYTLHTCWYGNTRSIQHHPINMQISFCGVIWWHHTSPRGNVANYKRHPQFSLFVSLLNVWNHTVPCLWATYFLCFIIHCLFIYFSDKLSDAKPTCCEVMYKQEYRRLLNIKTSTHQ